MRSSTAPLRLLLAFALVSTCVATMIACSNAPGSCESSADCSSGERCVSGKCAVAPPEDAGTDGGVDAGFVSDAGLDAGETDAGDDAGVDAGFDAGVMDAGYCAYDAGNPPNLLFNPGFECGVPPDGWIPFGDTQLATVSALAYDGAQAARLMSLDGGSMSLFPQTPPVTGGAGVKTYCASSYVNGNPGHTVRISLQAYGLGGGVQETSFSSPLAGGWERVGISAKTTINDDKVTMRVWMPSPTKGEQLFIDDAQLWVSGDGGCKER